jgi:transcriptional regulator with XRE-family HTH domain
MDRATRAPIAGALKAAMKRSGLSRYRISLETGIPQSTLSRFARGTADLRMESAEKLAVFFGLELLPKAGGGAAMPATKPRRSRKP